MTLSSVWYSDNPACILLWKDVQANLRSTGKNKDKMVIRHSKLNNKNR